MTRPRWRNFWCVLVVVSLSQAIPLRWCAIFAGEIVCCPSDPKKCSTGLKTNESAPYDGQLLTPKLAIELGQKAEAFDKRLELELNFRTRTLEIDLELEKSLRENDRESFDLERTLLMKRLEEAHSRPWYEHPAFVATATVVGVVLVIIGTGYALKQVD